MIVAESEGEYYLAISRRVSLADRMKLFEAADLDNVMSKAEGTKLQCKDALADYKGWVVSAYKREINGLKGHIFKGDYRKTTLPSLGESQAFEYTLLVSESNEHAIEIEKYSDGRTEVYATVYRRMNDIGEITHPGTSELSRPDIKLASISEPAPSTPVLSAKEQPAATTPPLMSSVPVAEMPAPVEPAKETLRTIPLAPSMMSPRPLEIPRAVPIKLQELAPQPLPEPISSSTPSTESPVKEQTPMATTEPAINGTRNDMSTAEAIKPKLYVQPTAPEAFNRQEVRTVNKELGNAFDTDSIECDLRVANKIIDEAIRNEMRLTDIVRRIIELPVAYPESVQIPVTLNDEDYALLAIRYGISSSDRNGIKRRILEDLNDFSGGKKKAA